MQRLKANSHVGAAEPVIQKRF